MPSCILELDKEILHEEKALDGYYIFLTSEMNRSDDDIIDVYREIWRIEESFKVVKRESEAKPVYV